MGSVKDLEVLESPTPDETGHGIFDFSDRYSVFDWGKMPEDIEGKGDVLAMMGAFTFEMFEEKGIKTHYMGMEEDGDVKSLDDLEGPSNRMHIELVNVLEPEFKDGEYDYSVLNDASFGNYLIPLEIIFRNTISVGSSARRRYDPRDLGLSLTEWPEEPVHLEDPILEASTKLEEQDRYIDDREARRISGIALGGVYDVAREVNRIITDRAESVGLQHDDGKIELLKVDDDIVVGDVAGTFDENRFTYEGIQVSKEILRQRYKESQPDWVEQVKDAKERAKDEGIKDWKSLVGVEPKSLGFEKLVSEMYKAGANRYIGEDFFDVRGVSEVMEDIKDEFEGT